jgi:hypothetical protein
LEFKVCERGNRRYRKMQNFVYRIRQPDEQKMGAQQFAPLDGRTFTTWVLAMVQFEIFIGLCVGLC